MNYLDDIEFLERVDLVPRRIQYAKITLLAFDTELPIKTIEGQITSGNLSVNGASAVRRTLTLSEIASVENSDIENLENEISLKRKVKVEIGYENPFANEGVYPDKILWFPCGDFVLSSASLSRSTSGFNISISGKDKMCLLDGTAGGVIPSQTAFHEREIQVNNKLTKYESPTIHQIIYEAVNHWGGIPADKIVISDIDEEVRMLVKYIGSDPIYFNDGFTAFSRQQSDSYQNVVVKGEDVGYKMTPFTYPGELILKAGDTVVTLLDNIVKVLGNFEYFFDVHGNFIFREIRNYLNTASPLKELEEAIGKAKEEDTEACYIKDYNNEKYLYDLTSLDNTTQITSTPKYDNIKNDYYVWGQRQNPSGAKVDICYHLIIDKRPERNYFDKDICGVISAAGTFVTYTDGLELLRLKDFGSGTSIATNGPLKLQITNITNMPQVKDLFAYRANSTDKGENVYKITSIDSDHNSCIAELISTYCAAPAMKDQRFEWREELYRRALLAQSNSLILEDNYYSSEMLRFWRELYDPIKWNMNTPWNPVVTTANKRRWNELNYWIDMIDTSSALGNYSINSIGRRTKVVNNTSLNSIFNKEVNDTIFIPSDVSEEERNRLIKLVPNYFFLNKANQDLFSISSTGASCFDEMRNALYQYLTYNTQIQITCLPKYYLEPNNIIHIEDIQSHISGNYQITQFNLPLAYNGTMSITATEVVAKV